MGAKQPNPPPDRTPEERAAQRQFTSPPPPPKKGEVLRLEVGVSAKTLIDYEKLVQEYREVLTAVVDGTSGIGIQNLLDYVADGGKDALTLRILKLIG